MTMTMPEIELAPRGHGAPSLRRTVRDSTAGRRQDAWTPGIHQVIDARAVRTLFQPLVHLQTKEIVGFEALSRGPVGSALESPGDLFDAAARTGRLGELDWICRANAMRAAAASGLPRNLSWFLNVEPAGLGAACPEDLLPALDSARRDLRVVLEVVERGVESHLPQVLHLVRQARAGGCGIAMDDVGAEEASLTLLPVLQPDVVKLDMSLLRRENRAEAVRIAAAVRAYAHRRGAAILAEGIETAAQEQLAKAFGAQYGQGFRYGRPGPLPTQLDAPGRIIARRQRPRRAHCLTAGRDAIRRPATAPTAEASR